MDPNRERSAEHSKYMPESRCVTCGNQTAKHYKVLVSQFDQRIYFWCCDCIDLLAESLKDVSEAETAAKSRNPPADSGQEQGARSDAGGREPADQ